MPLLFFCQQKIVSSTQTLTMAGSRKQPGSKNDFPQAMKAAKFMPTEDDKYMTNLCIMIGPKKDAMHYEQLLLTLGMGHQLCGYDKIDFALPMFKDDIAELHRTMAESDWQLPPFNIKSGERQREY